MRTIYDWITMLIFAGLVTHYLSRAVQADAPTGRFAHYLIAGAGCAVANWLGNRGHEVEAWVLIAAVVAYIAFFVLHVGRRSSSG